MFVWGSYIRQFGVMSLTVAALKPSDQDIGFIATVNRGKLTDVRSKGRWQ